MIPHSWCLRSHPLLWSMATSDAAVALAYFLIPLTLYFVVRRVPFRQRSLRLWTIYSLIFVLSCGIGHAMNVWNLFHTAYWLEVAINFITACFSFAALYWLIRTIQDGAIAMVLLRQMDRTGLFERIDRSLLGVDQALQILKR